MEDIQCLFLSAFFLILCVYLPFSLMDAEPFNKVFLGVVCSYSSLLFIFLRSYQIKFSEILMLF